MICLYDANETNFNHNGLVVLSDCESAYVEEKNNDTYEYTLEYAIDSRGKWQYLVDGNIIKSSEGQLFRIYHKATTLTSVKINARHIFYDLLDNFLEDVRPTNQSGAGALDWILTHTQYPHNFTSMSDIQHIDTAYYQKKNPVQALLGNDDNSFVKLWGGEIVRDNFTIKILQARGMDRGVLISYGKNILGIEETKDLDSVITRIYPTGKDGLTLPEKYVDSQYINNYTHPKIKRIEFTDIDNEADLRVAAQNYFINTKCDIPLVNYKVNFIQLSKTEEYKNYAILETVHMCDTVTVKLSKLNIYIKCKVIRIKRNDLTGRIEEVELGSFKPDISDAFTNLNNNISAANGSITQVKSDYQKAIDNATALITGSKGGNVVIRQDANGHPSEILVMDTTDINTAEKVWRWNINGFGYSSTGINGPYNTAITMDGHIVASFITALVISGEMIKAGTIQSKTGKWQLNLDGETINLGSALAFDGSTLTLGSGVALDWSKITKPAYSASDVGARPNTWTPSASDVGARSNTWMPSASDVGARPSSWTPNAIEVGALPESWVGTTYIDKNGVYTGTVRCDQLASATKNPIIRLFENVNGGNPALDATDNNNTGFGTSMRLKWNDSNYIQILTNYIAFYLNGNNNAILSEPDNQATFWGVRVGRQNEIYSGGTIWINYRGGSGLEVGNGSATGGFGPIYGSTKNAVTGTTDYGNVVTYADESPNHVFNDRGVGILNESGQCYIYLDPIFLETVNTKQADYWVQLTGFKGAGVEIEDQQADYFVVCGTPGRKFYWEITAERKGMERLRWNDADIYI